MMKRFTEPSTWAGVAALLQVLSAFLPPQYQPIVTAITAAAGAGAVALREQTGG